MKLLKNFSSEDFVHMWDSKPYLIKAGQEIYLEDFLAEHLAKHLVDREMLKADLMVDNSRRPEFEAKALSSAEAIPEFQGLPEKAQAINMNMEKEEVVPEAVEEKPVEKKRGRPKKDEEKDESEEEFAEAK